MSDQDMKLPEGKTCGDCAHYKRCVALFECPATNTWCDWAPSRFRQREPEHDWQWYDRNLRATGYTDLANRMLVEFKQSRRGTE